MEFRITLKKLLDWSSRLIKKRESIADNKSKKRISNLVKEDEAMAGINLIAGVAQQKKANSPIRIVADDAVLAYGKAAEKSNAGENEDATVQISEEARQKYMELEMLKQNAENLREQRKAGEEYAEDLVKIMEIFRRIARGDKVPSTDEKKLMEYSSELYQAAKSAAMLVRNKERKEYKALFEEEDEPDKSTQAMREQSTDSVEKPENAGISFENVGVVVSK